MNEKDQNLYYYRHIINNISNLVMYSLTKKGILNEYYFEEKINNFSLLPVGDSQRIEIKYRLDKILKDNKEIKKNKKK